MSAAAAHLRSADDWTAAPGTALGRSAAAQRRLLEERLRAESAGLARGLDGVGTVLDRAVGTRGRGGSRWRPLLTLAVSEALHAAPAEALDVAVAVELTHTASLVLDDLPCMDDAESRRGQPATHRLVGSAGAILLSVGLLARAAELLGRQPCCGGALAEEWGHTIGLAGMAGGQAMDVRAQGPLLGAPRRLHRAKSGALPAFALSAGARIADVSDATRASLAAFGRGLGWAYQLMDDVRDLDEDARLGRGPGGHQPLRLSRRIMRLAYRRLDGIRELGDDGRAILVGLASRVVPDGPDAAGPFPAGLGGRP